VALNPVIKFTTLFGLLAVELAVKLTSETGGTLSHILAAAFSPSRSRLCIAHSTACASAAPPRNSRRGRSS